MALRRSMRSPLISTMTDSPPSSTAFATFSYDSLLTAWRSPSPPPPCPPPPPEPPLLPEPPDIACAASGRFQPDIAPPAPAAAPANAGPVIADSAPRRRLPITASLCSLATVTSSSFSFSAYSITCHLASVSRASSIFCSAASCAPSVFSLMSRRISSFSLVSATEAAPPARRTPRATADRFTPLSSSRSSAVSATSWGLCDRDPSLLSSASLCVFSYSSSLAKSCIMSARIISLVLSDLSSDGALSSSGRDLPVRTRTTSSTSRSWGVNVATAGGLLPKRTPSPSPRLASRPEAAPAFPSGSGCSPLLFARVMTR